MASVSKYSDMTSLALTKLCLAADYYAEVSPALARFFIDKVDRIKERSGLPPTASHLRCQFCGAVFRPGNHHSHVKAQMKETRKIQQLRKHEETPGCRLGRFQRRLLDMYTNRKNCLTIVCDVCNKRTRVWFPGEREKGAKGTCEEILVPDTSKMSRSAKKKLKKKLKKKKQQSEGGVTPDVARLTAASTSRISQHAS
ncbi:hypothetical protein NP493_54g04043 [Ridgeia piscesae]|uniref:Uncharacterized protein n=1 Tax=Ridgeia piscesae TaxID=27915 RepID=A0AAD9PAW3_RIDPI|nr:hypothetical protein NP493_54g04043 [Ridgeia piscesae]